MLRETVVHVYGENAIIDDGEHDGSFSYIENYIEHDYTLD